MADSLDGGPVEADNFFGSRPEFFPTGAIAIQDHIFDPSPIEPKPAFPFPFPTATDGLPEDWVSPDVAFQDPATIGPMPFWNVLDVVLIVVAFLGLMVPGVLLVRFAFPKDEAGGFSLGLPLSMLVVQVIASLSSVYGVGRIRHGYGWRDLGFRPTRWVWWLTAVGGGLACLPLLGLIGMLVARLMGQQELENPQLPFLAPGSRFSWVGGLGMFLLAGLLVPLAEELFFRGVLYRFFRRGMGLWPAAILAGILFGIAHMNVMIGAAVVPLGILAAIVYEYSGSLWTPVVVHAVNNAPKILLLYLMLAFGLTPEKIQEWARKAQEDAAAVVLTVPGLDSSGQDRPLSISSGPHF